MKTFRLIRRFTSPAATPQTHRINVQDYQSIVMWAIQQAAGGATANIGFTDSAGADHAVYRAGAAIPAAEPGVILGVWSREGGYAPANFSFGPPPGTLYFLVSSAGAGLTTTVELWGYRDEDA